ncbi:MAG: hypothetical protein FWF05_09520 [Oscillospiraceae bacterium]|nr:hypothetical protein [Oscillospiraceae bacterium]
MSAISALPADIVAWLSGQEPLSGLRFMTEFPATKKTVPLKKAIVAVGLENVGIQDSFTETDGGVLIKNEYCRLANLKIRLAIHVPFSDGGARCHDIFSAIIDCLTFASDLNIIESGCSDVTADRDTDAFVLNAWITVKSDFCPAESSDMNFQSFLDKELLCGSHIRDDVIHVTADDKTLWNEPFVFGYYAGNSASSMTVSLAFQPRLVLVFAHQRPLMQPTSATTATLFSGIAFPDYGTLGLEIVNKGFRVSSPGVINGGTAAMNNSGYMYGYVAFK